MKFYEFHDTELSGIVENAYHAVAIDEHRLDYDVCLWNPKSKPGQTMEQRWFVGAHCDVGGGYADRRLSDLPLRWMQDKASALGLGLTPAALGAENYRVSIHRFVYKISQGPVREEKPRHYRSIGASHSATKWWTRQCNKGAKPTRATNRKITAAEVGLDRITVVRCGFRS
jgi:hypothetical protein